MLFPGLAWGADVRLSIAGSTEYDNNITRTNNDDNQPDSTNKENDVVFRVTPGIRVVEDREKFNYSAGYTLPYEVGVKHGSINDLNQLADANFSYRATPTTQVFGNDGFFYVRGLFSQDQDLIDPTTGQVGDNRDRILQNNVMLGVKHLFTPRLSGTVMVNQGVYDTNQFNRANVLSFGGRASSEYTLTPHHTLGGGFSYSRQMFQDTVNRPSSDTDYYNLFGSWEWMFDETTNFSIAVGPAVIHSSQTAGPSTGTVRQIPFSVNKDGTSATVYAFDLANCPMVKDKVGGVETDYPVLVDTGGRSCPTLTTTDPGDIAFFTSDVFNPEVTVGYVSPPESVHPTRVTYFANASLTKRWSPNLASSLAYDRQDNGASGIDGGAVIDAVTLSHSWRISERWDAAVRTDWTQRTSATDSTRTFVIPGAPIAAAPGVATSGQLVQIESSDSLDTQRWGVAARIAYRLTKNTVTSLQYTYNKQSSKDDSVGEDSDFDNHLVTFTVQYNFEPIELPW